MKRPGRYCGVLAGAATFFAAGQVNAAVGLIFSDNDSTPASTAATPGATFPFSVKLTESASNDKVNGVSYKIHASANGVFELLSRNSTASTGGTFTSDNNNGDASITPYILNAVNDGQDLGAGTATNGNVSATTYPATFEVADFSFEVLPSAPKGIYSLSFTSSSYSFANGTTSPVFDSLGTFTVSVPEPASVALVGIFGAGLSLRRNRMQLK